MARFRLQFTLQTLLIVRSTDSPKADYTAQVRRAGINIVARVNVTSR